jgi:four helix bundle protein
MKENVLAIKSLSFAIRIVNLYQFLTVDKKEFVISKQLLRSGTSIGANIRESIYAQSRSDFVHKLQLSLKETSETEYWILLLYETKLISKRMFNSIVYDCIEILKLLISSINTVRGK